jgi:hypothetical protein
LSDATLQAALAVETTTPALSRATAARREWDVFPGTLSGEVESAGDVDVDDHSGRAYNIGIEPTVDPQDGPGEKAADEVAANLASGAAETSEPSGPTSEP